MSALSNRNKSAGPHRRPRANVYTLMLVVALIAVLWANVLLYFLAKEYDFDYKRGPRADAGQRYDNFAAKPLPQLNTWPDSPLAVT